MLLAQLQQSFFVAGVCFFFVCYGLGSIFVRAGAAHCYAVMPRVLIVFILLLKSAI